MAADGSALPSQQDLVQQVLNITGVLNQALERIVQLEQKVEANGTRSHTKKSPLEGKGGLYDMTQIMPDRLSRVADFKEWSEDYREYVAAQSEALAEMLDTARDWKERITRMGDDGDTVELAKALYKSLKKTVVHQEGRALVVTVPDKNAFEAWRLLHAKFDSRNDASA